MHKITTKRGITMTSNILAVIRSLYPALTPSGRQVADYVLVHGEEVIFMPITELAYRCSVSETSIMRFCQQAGMSGYQDFRLRLSSALSAEQLLRPETSDSGDAITQLIDKIYQSFHTIIQGTKQLFRPELLQETAKHVRNAKEIFFFGFGDSMQLAANACHSFMRSLRKGRCGLDSYAQELLLSQLTRDDLAFFVYTRPDNNELYKLAERAKRTGAKMIGISCCGPTSVSGLCNVNLYSGRTDPAVLKSTSTRESCLNLASVSFLVELLCTGCQEAVLPPAPEVPAEPASPPPLPQSYYPDH